MKAFNNGGAYTSSYLGLSIKLQENIHTFIAFSAMTFAFFKRSVFSVVVLRLTGSGDGQGVDIFHRFLVCFKISCSQIVGEILSKRSHIYNRTFNNGSTNNDFLYVLNTKTMFYALTTAFLPSLTVSKWLHGGLL